jgi:hypothetical protein
MDAAQLFFGGIALANTVIILRINNAVTNMARDLEKQAAANDKELREWVDEKFVSKETFAALKHARS